VLQWIQKRPCKIVVPSSVDPAGARAFVIDQGLDPDSRHGAACAVIFQSRPMKAAVERAAVSLADGAAWSRSLLLTFSLQTPKRHNAQIHCQIQRFFRAIHTIRPLKSHSVTPTKRQQSFENQGFSFPSP
jgi:hypothetical protein